MRDDSHLDDKYFIDPYVYNCPFCNRRNVKYDVVQKSVFEWTHNKRCYVYFVRCSSCNYDSMHLTFTDIDLQRIPGPFAVDATDLDEHFFYSVPTSFFTIDERIPRVLRELFSEAEGCLKSNFLTGASVCARKIVYELAKREGSQGDTYEDRIKSLKQQHSEVEPSYFDTLLTIQQVTSDKVHEDAHDGWKSKHLRLILASLNEILREIYVLPKLREERRAALLDLRGEVLGKSSPETEVQESQDTPEESQVAE